MPRTDYENVAIPFSASPDELRALFRARATAGRPHKALPERACDRLLALLGLDPTHASFTGIAAKRSALAASLVSHPWYCVLAFENLQHDGPGSHPAAPLLQGHTHATSSVSSLPAVGELPDLTRDAQGWLRADGEWFPAVAGSVEGEARVPPPLPLPAPSPATSPFLHGKTGRRRIFHGVV